MDDSYEPIFPDDAAPADAPAFPADGPESLDEPPPRKRASEPPPLPRLWKTPADSEEMATQPPPPAAAAEAPARKKRGGGDSPGKAEKPRRKKKAEAAPIDDGTGAVKLEETPVLDTYEARQRARWLIGGVLGAIAVVVGTLVVNAFKGNGPAEEARDGEPPADSRTSGQPKATAEREARIVFDNARQADQNGKAAAALEQLRKLVKVYPGTAAAREASHALDRAKNDLPPFGLDGPEMATGPKLAPPGTPTATGPATPKGVDKAASNPGKAAPTTASAPPPTPPPAAPTPPPQPIVSKPLPAGYRAKYEFPIHPSGWPTRIVAERDGAEMVLVPTATFLMGRDDGEPEERPTHEVGVSTFYIDLHEVTVRQYLAYLKESGRLIDASKFSSGDHPGGDDLPVVNVTARDAKAYCTWMKRRLPTEAQWELAARGKEGRVSYWNGELPRKDPAKGHRAMEPVMSLPADCSPYGAFDMAANAWEWTSEYFDSKYYQQFRAMVVDPTGPKESPARMAKVTVKGGSKAGILTWREGLNIENKSPWVGFRGALPVEGAPVAPPPIAAPVPGPNQGPALNGGVVPF